MTGSKLVLQTASSYINYDCLRLNYMQSSQCLCYFGILYKHNIIIMLFVKTIMIKVGQTREKKVTYCNKKKGEGNINFVYHRSLAIS